MFYYMSIAYFSYPFLTDRYFSCPHFCLSWIMLLWTFFYKSLCGYLFFSSLGRYLGLELLIHMVPPFLTLWEAIKVFSRVNAPMNSYFLLWMSVFDYFLSWTPLCHFVLVIICFTYNLLLFAFLMFNVRGFFFSPGLFCDSFPWLFSLSHAIFVSAFSLYLYNVIQQRTLHFLAFWIFRFIKTMLWSLLSCCHTILITLSGLLCSCLLSKAGCPQAGYHLLCETGLPSPLS